MLYERLVRSIDLRSISGHLQTILLRFEQVFAVFFGRFIFANFGL